MKRVIRNLVLGSSLLLINSSASAVLLESDWLVSGDSLLTHDTDTGLEWLDLTATASQSFDQVSAQFGVGGLYEGFMYASTSDVGTLFDNAGVTHAHIATYSEANLVPALHLLDLIGVTAPTTKPSLNDGTYFSQGITSTFAIGNRNFAPYIAICEAPDQPCVSVDMAKATTTQANQDKRTATLTLGSFLYRPALSRVPEPSTIMLLGFGLLAGVAMRRRG